MSALIGALRASLSLETAQFEAGARRAQRTANNLNSSFKKSFGGLGAITKAGLAGVVSGLSIGLIAQGVKAALDYAGSLKEVSQQLGVTTKDLQVFRFAAGQVGVSQNELERGLTRLTVTLGKVEAGAKAPAKALAAIGISVDEIRRLDTGEAFRLIADGLEKVTDRSQRAAVEVALFGREGAKLDNLLAGGSSQINELSLAAEKLGIVLSDEQIQKADDTADKLEAMKTVLSAQIAGVVADNADAILALADALATVVNAAASALRAFSGFVSYVKQNPLAALNPAGALGAYIGQQVAGKKLGPSATVMLPPAKAPARPRGADISQFLAGGGGSKGRSKKDDSARLAEQERRRAFQVSQESLRADLDILRAKQSLSTDFVERAALSIEILNLEKKGFEEELAFRVQEGDLKKAEADILRLKFEQRDALERQAVLAEEEAQRKEDYNRLDQLDFDLQRDILQSQEQLADTAKEQRDIRLRLLDLDYRAERARLEAVLADEKASWAAKEEARRRLANLNKTFGNDQQAVIRGTAGPFEQAQMQFGDLTEEMENLKVNGIMAAGDALATLATEGFGSFKDAAISAIKAVIAEFIRLQMIKMLFNVIGSAAGAPGAGSALGSGGMFSPGNPGVGFAGGGSFVVNGLGGLDRNVLSINGIPMAKVDNRERISIDSVRHGRGGDSPVNISFAISGPVTRETQMQIAAATRRGIASANRKGM